MTSSIRQFEVGQTYAQRFICDSDTFSFFTVTARTAKTITTEVHGKTVRRRLFDHCGVEHFKPYGNHSMAMVVGADDTADEVPAALRGGR